VVTALGIVVAELVTNSYDHAFSSQQGRGHVSVHRARDGGMATLTISNGSGFEAEAEGKRHGLGLIRRLIEQVRGTVSVESGHDTV
jgi:two-component sensor histidine kinase